MNTILKKNLFLLLIYIVAIVALSLFWSYLGKSVKLPEPYGAGEKIESVSYAPFKYDESPMDFTNGLVIADDRIDKDLELLSKQFNSVRTYSVHGLESVPKYARKHGLKVILGAWIGSDDTLNQAEIKKAIELSKEYSDVITAVVVGNEVLLRREISAGKLASYIKQVKEALPHTKVTYADVWEFWLKNPELAPLVDFVTIHILPYWEDIPISIEDALTHIKKTHAEVAHILQNKEILIGETGWPSEGRMRGESYASPIAQAQYLRGFLSLAKENGWQYNLIEAFDQPWKRVSEGAVGGYWGLYDKNSHDKNALFGEVQDFANFQTLFLITLLFLILSFFIQIKNNSSDFRALAFSSISAVLFALQFNQYSIAHKDMIDFVRIGVLFVTFFILYLQVLLYLVHAKFNVQMVNLAQNGSVVLFLIESLYLVIDGRYRSFESYSALFMIIAYVTLSRFKNQTSTFVSFEKLSSIAIFILAFALVFSEGVHNFQALIYAFLSLVFAYIVFKESSHADIAIFYRYIIFSAVVASLIWVWKNQYFINEAYVLICENSPQNINCMVRRVLGVFMFHKVLGFSSLVFTLIFAIFKKEFLGYIAIISSLMAILFFNTSIGVISLVLVLIFFMLRTQRA